MIQEPDPPLGNAPFEDIGVLVQPEFLSPEQCARLRLAMDRGQAAAAEIYAGGYVVDDQVRKSFDVDVDPGAVREVERALQAVRADVGRFFGTALTGAEGPGFLRYPAGGFYRAHRDGLEDPGDEFPRRISVVLFLSSAIPGGGDGCCEGGALRLHGIAGRGGEAVTLDIPPAAGTLVAFRSDVLHEVLPVTGGVRDAIVDWFY